MRCISPSQALKALRSYTAPQVNFVRVSSTQVSSPHLRAFNTYVFCLVADSDNSPSSNGFHSLVMLTVMIQEPKPPRSMDSNVLFRARFFVWKPLLQRFQKPRGPYTFFMCDHLPWLQSHFRKSPSLWGEKKTIIVATAFT